ncbi:30S ribosomal protein S9, partial [Varanus komodoensis]
MAGTFSSFPLGWEVDSVSAGAPEGRRQDWRQTSSGVGLNYSPPLPFPPPYARSTIHEPLPPASEKVLQNEVIPRLSTTTQLAHGPKTHGGVLSVPRYSVACSHYDVLYNKDLREKVIYEIFGVEPSLEVQVTAVAKSAFLQLLPIQQLRPYLDEHCLATVTHVPLKLRAWRFPLTMRNQKSEMRDRYPGWPNLPHDPTFHAGPQPFGLAAHHRDGASKVL